MRVDWDELRRIKAEGLLAIVPHPDPAAGLWLLNYTARAQFQGAWDQYPILLGCRGTIVTAAGEVVAHPFKKFFNAGERPETRLEALATLGAPEVTHKLDGCFLSQTRLNLWGGGTVEIGDVVRNKLRPVLVGQDEAGAIVPCEVLEHFKNGRKDAWLDITVDHPSSPRWTTGSWPNILRVTPNHHIWLNGRYQAAVMARLGDTVTTYEYMPSPSVLHLIQSSLLGDGCLMASQNMLRYQEPHRRDHADYSQLLTSWLGTCAIASRETISGYSSPLIWAQSKSYKTLRPLRDAWYENGRKRIPEDLSWMDDFSVAKWYMDDGSLAHHVAQQDRALFATNCFTESDVRRLGERLRDMYGVSCTVYQSKGWCLRVNAEREGTIDNLWQPIAPHVVPVMRYKLPERYRNVAYRPYPMGCECVAPHLATVVNVQESDLKGTAFASGRTGFDIQTTTGNYFAKGVLVHNSMCVLYPYTGAHRMATRGSFVSSQARRATEIWEERYATLESLLDPGLTYVFELVGPGNRIVVRYEQEGLILIGLVVTATGHELSYADVDREGRRLGLPYVEKEELEGDWQALMREQRPNFEGFVLFWPGHNLRVKVKLEDYVRLHRIISGLSEHVVWEHLRAGTNLETVREVVPEEMRAWLDATAAALNHAHTTLAAEVARVVALVRAARLDPADRAQRKEVAAIVLREGGEARPAVFLALDGKPYDDALWRLLEPRASEPVRPLEE